MVRYNCKICLSVDLDPRLTWLMVSVNSTRELYSSMTTCDRIRAMTKQRKLTVPEHHELKIARRTMKLTDQMITVLGGPSKSEARATIRRITGKNN